MRRSAILAAAAKEVLGGSHTEEESTRLVRGALLPYEGGRPTFENTTVYRLAYPLVNDGKPAYFEVTNRLILTSGRGQLLLAAWRVGRRYGLGIVRRDTFDGEEWGQLYHTATGETVDMRQEGKGHDWMIFGTAVGVCNYPDPCNPKGEEGLWATISSSGLRVSAEGRFLFRGDDEVTA